MLIRRSEESVWPRVLVAATISLTVLMCLPITAEARTGKCHQYRYTDPPSEGTFERLDSVRNMSCNYAMRDIRGTKNISFGTRYVSSRHFTCVVTDGSSDGLVGHYRCSRGRLAYRFWFADS